MIEYLRNRRKIRESKGILLFLGVVLLMAFVTATGYHPEAFRLHIIANSDSRADQAVKLLVRDQVMEYIEETETGGDMEAYFSDHAGEIEAVAEGVLASRGFSYGAKAMVGPAEYPWRELEGQIYPAGAYESMRVVLGDGNGQNWWCVMFPPLSLVDVDQAEEEQVEYKSFFAELWERIFGAKEG